MTQFINRVEAIVKFIGEKSSILNVVLVVLICVDVIQRYLFNQSHNWVIELEWHLFGLIFLLGSAFTLQQDKHVRVDVFYNGLSDKKKAIIDILGGVCLLLPMCLVGIRTCYNYASNSFYIRESSPNPGGLPALWIIKYFVVICFVLLLLQGVATIFKNIKILTR